MGKQNANWFANSFGATSGVLVSIILILVILPGIIVIAMCGGCGYIAKRAADAAAESAHRRADELRARSDKDDPRAAPSPTPTVVTPPPSNPEPDPTPPAEPPISNVTWSEIDKIYNLGSKSTTIQKDELWKRYEGKRVRWSGSVVEISDTFGTLTLNVKMNPTTVLFDLAIELQDDQRDAALSLTKDQRITFTGTLDAWGSILPIRLTNGTLVDPDAAPIPRPAAPREKTAQERDAEAATTAKQLAEEKAAATKAKQAADEKAAASKVRLAKLTLKQGKTSAAKRRLQETIDTYPDTAAAKEAAELLKELD